MGLLQPIYIPFALLLLPFLQALPGQAFPPIAANSAPASPVLRSHLSSNPVPGPVRVGGEKGNYTASVLVPVSMQRAWRVLSNYESMAGVMPDIKQAKVLSRTGKNLEIAQVYQAPYTFGQRINVRLRIQESPPSRMDYALISGDRIKELQGSWTITPVKGGVVVKHQIQVVPDIPSFLLGTYYELTEANLRQSMQILANLMLTS